MQPKLSSFNLWQYNFRKGKVSQQNKNTMRDKMQYKIVVKKNLAVARKICMKKVIFIMKSRPLKKSEEEEESSTQLCNG